MYKIVATVILSLSFTAIAFWLGEAGKGIFQIAPYAIGSLGCVVIAMTCTKKKKIKILTTIAFATLYACSFYLGDVSFYRTFNNCIIDAETIRHNLQNYYKSKESYPSTLEQLKITIPCQRVIRGSLLEYRLTESGYNLSFRDWLTEHVATESETFMAQK